uniref:Transposable element P transposase-like RNase H domain-containing protein n=1 Tax=Amphimedon queenslandica TaxID=400682 RepID=A0A1X7UCH1_AMPQE
MRFKKSLDSENTPPPLAKSMVSFMVKGLFTSLKFPYAQFPCVSLVGEQLFPLFWEAVFRLERIGFKVIATTFDGTSVNRRLVALHDLSDKLVYKILNIHAEEKRTFLLEDTRELQEEIEEKGIQAENGIQAEKGIQAEEGIQAEKEIQAEEGIQAKKKIEEEEEIEEEEIEEEEIEEEDEIQAEGEKEEMSRKGRNSRRGGKEEGSEDFVHEKDDEEEDEEDHEEEKKSKRRRVNQKDI